VKKGQTVKRRIIILANSIRDRARCIAGIDIQTGKWLRPVSPPDGGAVAWELRNVEGREPCLKEIVEISVQDSGPDHGCQPENRLLNHRQWVHIDIMHTEDLLRYCEDDTVILHNDRDYVEPGYFQTIPKRQWKSLQLVRPSAVQFYAKTWKGRNRWRALIRHGANKQLDLGLTDPVLIERLNRDEETSQDCFLTISLAGPWTPDGVQPERCYKLVAGVIEL